LKCKYTGRDPSTTACTACETARNTRLCKQYSFLKLIEQLRTLTVVRRAQQSALIAVGAACKF
jgi:hypothetical protein